jgi:PKHD-type hydroxylase
VRQNWQLWEAELSPIECDEIIQLGLSEELTDGTIFSQQGRYEVEQSFRDTKIRWIDDGRIRNIAMDYLMKANRLAFNFDINYLPALQFGEYSEGSFYLFHNDIDWTSDIMYDRKLSICIQLSDPDDYIGGEFEFETLENPTGYKTRGSILVFPSYNEHQITEITKGVRYSLVGWMEGPRWR